MTFGAREKKKRLEMTQRNGTKHVKQHNTNSELYSFQSHTHTHKMRAQELEFGWISILAKQMKQKLNEQKKKRNE